MMLKRMLLVVLSVCAGPAFAREDDPEMAAALAQCPGAAEFVARHGSPSARRAKAAATAAAPSDPQLRQRLLDMERLDQEVRSKGFGALTQEDIQRWMAVDTANLPQIKAIVAEHGGLPTVAQVGADGVAAAWILVQHADADPAFQAEVLEKIAPSLGSGEVTAHEHALLTDRVLAGQGKPQRYGSQLQPDNGKWVPKPLEDPENVDARRAAVGEMPLADYICVASQLVGPPPPDGGKPADE